MEFGDTQRMTQLFHELTNKISAYDDLSLIERRLVFGWVESLLHSYPCFSPSSVPLSDVDKETLKETLKEALVDLAGVDPRAVVEAAVKAVVPAEGAVDTGQGA